MRNDNRERNMMALVYGGSGSGKSEFAENLLSASGNGEGPLLYIATMFPGDREARARIERHRANRAHRGFATMEVYTGLGRVAIPRGASVLLECLGNLMANEMFSPAGAGRSAEQAVLDGLDHVARQAGRVIVVANDVFSDGEEYPPETEEYRRALAAATAAVAGRSCMVVETVCGIPLWHKRNGAWNA